MKNWTTVLTAAGIIATGGFISLQSASDKPSKPTPVVEYDPASLPACEGTDGLAGELPCLLRTPENLVVIQEDTSRIVVADR